MHFNDPIWDRVLSHLPFAIHQPLLPLKHYPQCAAADVRVHVLLVFLRALSFTHSTGLVRILIIITHQSEHSKPDETRVT